jgi:hypothetical protein
MARSAIVSAVVTGGLVAALLSAGDAETPAPARVAATERPAGTIVFASDSNRLTAIDVATGRRVARRIRSVPGCGGQLFVTGGHVVFSGELKRRTTVFSVPLALDRAPTRLGAAHQFAASATDGRVWLAGTDCDRTSMHGVREVTIDGQVTFESDRRVPAEALAGAVPDGLLVSRRRALGVWDPATGTDRAVGLEWAFGIEGNMLAGCATGSDCGKFVIVDSASGRTVPVHASGRRVLEMGGTFSPDGTLLATPARMGHRNAVALVDARTGTHTIVPGSRTGKIYPDVRWARSTGWLFIRDGRRVRAYRPGAPRAQTLPIRLPRALMAFTVG